MHFELIICVRKHDILVQPVLDGVFYQTEYMEKEEYRELVESLKEVVEDAERYLE